MYKIMNIIFMLLIFVNILIFGTIEQKIYKLIPIIYILLILIGVVINDKYFWRDENDW